MTRFRLGARASFLLRRLALALIAFPALPQAASAACATPESNSRCQNNFDALGAVAWVGNGFVAIGRTRTKTPSSWAMVSVAENGTQSPPVPLPNWGSDAEMASADFHKIIALPNGALAFVGSFTPANSPWFAGLVLTVNSKGRLKWVGRDNDSSANVLLQSGAYDAGTNTVMTVGRVTAGGDDGTCRNWSRSLVQGFDASTGDLTDPQILGGAPAPGPDNRQAVYDIAPTASPQQYAVLGFQSTRDGSTPRCKDILQIGTLSLGPPGGGRSRWSANWIGRPNSASAGSEDGYGLAFLGGNEFAVAGQIGDLSAGPSLAHALRFRLNPFAVERTLDAPSSGLGGAQGAARFRAVTLLHNSKHLFFAGSITGSGTPASTVALSTVTAVDLAMAEAAVVEEDGASDLLGAAASTDGVVLAVGYANDAKGKRIGWLEFFSGSSAQSAGARPQPASAAITEPLRQARPNRSLPALQKAFTRTGSDYQIPDGDLRSPSRVYLSGLPEGFPLDIVFTPAAPLVAQVLIVVGSGDVDLALFNSKGELVDFSNYRQGTQIVIAPLEPRPYKLSLLAENDARDVEIDIGRAKAIDLPSLRALTAALAPADRETLSDKLARDGLSRASEPSIGFGSETVLSLIADQSAVGGVPAKILEQVPRNLEFAR